MSETCAGEDRHGDGRRATPGAPTAAQTNHFRPNNVVFLQLYPLFSFVEQVGTETTCAARTGEFFVCQMQITTIPVHPVPQNYSTCCPITFT